VTTLHTVMLVVATLWVVIGLFFTVIAIHELFDPAKGQDRAEQRRRTLDRFHADAITDYMKTESALLRVFLSVLVCWPWLVWRTLRVGDHRG